jgi:hypothetical protein
LSLLILATKWVVPEKIHTPHTEEISAVRRGRGEKMFLIIVSVLGHPKGVGGLTSNFLCGGGMDVFWNDPIQNCCTNISNEGCRLGRFFGGVFGFIFKPFFLFRKTRQPSLCNCLLFNSQKMTLKKIIFFSIKSV